MKTRTDQGHPDPNDHGKEQYKRHIDGAVRVSGQIEVHLPPDTVKENQTEGEEKRSYRKNNFIVSFITLIFVIVYAGLTGWQACSTQGSLDAIKKQFEIDQRPYVWTNESMEPPGMKIVQGEKLTINIDWVNYGKSPALRAASLGQIYIGSDAMQKADKWFAGLGDRPLPPPIDGLAKERVIPPGIGSRDMGFGGYSTFATDHELTEAEFTYITHTDRSIAIIMRVDYYDASGKRYWDDICLSRFTDGAVPHCDKHNEMH